MLTHKWRAEKNMLTNLEKFLDVSAKNLRMVRYGKNLVDKLKIFYYGCLNIYNNLRMSKLELKRILPSLNRLMSLKSETTLIIKGFKFTLPDIASIGLFYDEFEKWIWNYLKVQEGEVFCDIGAHIGKYTLEVARLVGKNGMVVAVEPHPKNYKLLLKNIQENGIKNVIAFNVAAWNDNRKMKLFMGKNSGAHSLKKDLQIWHGFETRQTITVQARRMDDILKTLELKVDWIKIDVEAAEIEVLQGLQETLRKDKPKLIIECWKPNQRKLKVLMEKFGYNVEPTPSPTNFFCFCLNSVKKNVIN